MHILHRRGLMLVTGAALALFVFACLWRLAFTGGILARGDTLTYFYPYWHARSAALLAGQLPLWSPDLFGGVPLLANSQIGTFYPPNWILAPFSPPDAIRISIFIHLIWAAWGMALLARRMIGARLSVAAAAGALFALGGAVGAHVEQINQLQGLSWIPWVFVAFLAAQTDLHRVLLLALALAMQFFTGHTQTLFITGVGLLIFSVAETRPDPSQRTMPLIALFYRLRPLLLGGLLALVLALPQLLPTLEMSSVSNRRGGLNPNEATAFSFSPLLAGRGLLPSYDRPELGDYLSSEYIAYLGVAGLMLAGCALAARRSSVPGRRAGLGLALAGLLLAFGLYNPLYFSVLAHLPGFNLFRVPARWLALFALGAVLLAAWTLETLARGELRLRRGWLIGGAIALIGLMTATPFGVEAANRLAGTPETTLPQARTFLGWAAALLAVGGVFALPVVARALRLPVRLQQAAARPQMQAALLVGLIGMELWAAAGAMPYNDLAPPSAYDSGRFTSYQLAALVAGQTPPARYLSISGLFFDPGDRALLEARYAAEGLPASGVRTALVAIKLEEVLGANLNLRFGLPSADGYDGGLLPTRFYTAFTAPMLLPGELRAVDGRLRERLAADACGGACIPALRWLDLLNVRYLVLDKTYDLWQDGTAYDTAFESVVTPGQPVQMRVEATFEATALDLLLDCRAESPCAAPEVTLSALCASAPCAALPVPLSVANAASVPLDRYTRVRLSFEQPARVQDVVLTAAALTGAQARVRAATLVDTRTGDFAQMAPSPWSQALSSDIKLYERDADSMLPRAFVVLGEARFVADDDAGTEAAMAQMAAPDFDPRTRVVLAAEPTAQNVAEPTAQDAAAQVPVAASATITHYTPEKMQLSVVSDQPGWLVLSEPYYPGWQALIDGVPTPILRANAMFRAVAIPAGASEVTFTYAPAWLTWGLLAGAVSALLTCGGIAFFAFRGRRGSR